MKVVADNELALDPTLFPPEIRLCRVDGRCLERHQLRDADALLVRSVTTVDAALLQDTAVRFVGTATSGTDHLDLEYLHSRSIRCLDAAGCNADAVVDYCLTALSLWLEESERKLQGLQVGIVGTGHTGTGLARRLTRLGCAVLVNDPPLVASGAADKALNYVPLETVSRCPVVSLHVPYTCGAGGADFPTHHLIDEDFLAAMPEQSLLINSCRSGVVDETACLQYLSDNNDSRAVIDVWEGEPEVRSGLVAAAMLATPHIAGYSNRAKTAAALTVQRGLLAFMTAGRSNALDQAKSNPVEPGRKKALKLECGDNFCEFLTEILPLPLLSGRFKAMAGQNRYRTGFDVLRRELRKRREFAEILLDARYLTRSQQQLYQALGFPLHHEKPSPIHA